MGLGDHHGHAITIVGFPIAIIYALLAGKKESLSVNTEESPGMTVVQIASNGGLGKSAGRALRDQLGMAPASVASVAPTQTRAARSGSGSWATAPCGAAR